MTFKYPLATSSWDESEYAAMQNVIKSGIFSMHENVFEFERQFSKYIGSNYCVMVNSGSSANLLMVASLFYSKNNRFKLKRGDEVIVPAVSWSTTYYPLYQYGLKLKFVDINLNTLNYDLDKLEYAVTDSTRVIMAVNLLGNPNDFKRIQKIIGDRDIVLLEDNCESMGASIDGKMAGSFGVMGSFSSFFSHHISTMEGGMVVTDDEELHHILLSLRAHGWTRNLPTNNHICTKDPDSFKEAFRFVLPGYNVRPLELSGAIGIAQLKKLPDIVHNRRKNAERMKSVFDNHPDIMMQLEVGNSSWFGFALIVRSSANFSRDKLIAMLQVKGFECRPIVSGNFAKNEVVKEYFDYEIFENLEKADYVDKNGLMIGNHHYSMEDAVNALQDLI